jgi:hypothetical protein
MFWTLGLGVLNLMETNHYLEKYNYVLKIALVSMLNMIPSRKHLLDSLVSIQLKKYLPT